jgi:hypothetical protein
MKLFQSITPEHTAESTFPDIKFSTSDVSFLEIYSSLLGIIVGGI